MIHPNGPTITILFHNAHLSMLLREYVFLIWMRSCGVSRVLPGAIEDLMCLRGGEF